MSATVPLPNRSVMVRSVLLTNSRTPGAAPSRSTRGPALPSSSTTKSRSRMISACRRPPPRPPAPPHPRQGPQPLRQRHSLGACVVEQAKPGGLPQEVDALEDVLGRLLAEARQLGPPPLASGLLQFGQALPVEGLVDLAHLG